MKFTPHISIYSESNFDITWFGDNLAKANFLFAKHLPYNKHLRKVRLNIHLGDEERISIEGAIKSIWVKFFTDRTVVLNDKQKLNLALKIIFDSIMVIAENSGWSTSGFEDAYEKSRSSIDDIVWRSEFKTNANRRFKARIKIAISSDGKVPVITEFLEISTGFIFEVSIIDTFLHKINWDRFYYQPLWLDNERFGYRLLNSELTICANAISREPETNISAREFSMDEINGELRQHTYRKFLNDQERIDWANQ